MSLFFCYNHQGKADSYIHALNARGWQETKDPAQARFILTDYMTSKDTSRRSQNLEIYRSKGIKVFIYSHAARPNVFWDFPEQEFPRSASVHFVAAPGHLEVMRAYGYPGPIEPVGWSLSKIRRFAPRPRLRNILFGPIHPNSNGFLCSLDKEINGEAFRQVLKLSESGVNIQVRYIGDLRENGLWKAGGVEYIKGRKDLSTEEIDRADLVVSHQTFAYLAVSRGVPTLMMGERHPPRWGGSDKELRFAKSWDKYRDLLSYPLDILEDDPKSLADIATSSDRYIIQWRERMIGRQFEPGLFVQKVKEYLK